MKFEHSTLRQLLRHLRDQYRNARGVRACRIARFFLAQSDADLQDAFPGMNAVQLTAFKNRLTNRKNAIDGVDGLNGE